MAAKKRAAVHPCIAQINKMLAPRGARLIGTLVLSGAPTPIVIATESTEFKKTKRPMLLTANFCPFCGEEMRK